MSRRQWKKKYKKQHGHNPVLGKSLGRAELKIIKEMIRKVDNADSYSREKYTFESIRELCAPDFEEWLMRQNKMARAIALVIRGKGVQKKVAGYCEWYACDLKDVTEYQQKECAENCMHCENCELLRARKEEDE